MRRAAVVCAMLLAGCGYPEIRFSDDAAPPADAPLDTTAPETASDTAPSVDTATADTSVAEDTQVDSTSTDTFVAPDVPPDVDAVDTGPTCAANVDCPCGQICSSGKCVASVDCTKDSHYCPGGATCTCVAGRWRINGSAYPPGSAVVPAQPVKITDHGANLFLRNYTLENVANMVQAIGVRTANCTEGWHYRDVVIQCVDVTVAGTTGVGGGISVSRRTDPTTCRPATPPTMLIDRVKIPPGSRYSNFTDLEFAKVTVRQVEIASGMLFDTWGPGKIGELHIVDSPNLRTELQGKIDKVFVKNSPGFRWWGSSITDDRTGWPLIAITYDAASCPSPGRALVSNAAIKETCSP